MAARSLLIFHLDAIRYGIDALLVREIVWLPELTPVEQAPPWVVGMFSLRGQIVAVTDLCLRLCHPARRHGTDNQVVVLELDGQLMGLIVSEVTDVIELADEAVKPPPQFESAAPPHAHLVAGEAQMGRELVTLLDIREIARLPETPEQAPASFWPEAAPEDRALFRARAEALMEAAAGEEGARLGMAVVELGEECFGIELSAVQEFCDSGRLCPIPCCPPHILGAIGLRGNLFTLLDPRTALNLKPAPDGCAKVVIARLDNQPVGIAVDAVHDVVYLRQDEIQPPPALLRERFGPEIKGTAPWGDRTMAVLDLPALLARKEWIVNETV